jgi:CRP-like cAMP-binding protein
MTSGMSDLLKSTPVFRRLAPPDRERVATLTSARQFERGDTIFSEGDPAEQFFVVVSGRVKVYKMTPAGKDVILEIFGAGDPLGAVAVYEGWPFPASAQALEETVCLAIARRDFFELLEQHPSLVRGLLAGLTMRLAELTGGRVEPRIARLFLKLANEIGRPERGGLFLPLSLSRQELADLSGTTIETAIRIMSRWSKQQIVLTEKDGFVIVNRPELETLALS